MAYSSFRLIKKTSSRTRRKGNQTGTKGALVGNSNAVKHGAHSKQIKTGLEMLNANSALFMHANEWRAEIIADLGGEENLSTIELTLLRRALYLELKLTLFETQQKGETGRATDEVYLSWQGAQVRTLEKLGLKRRKKTVSNLVEAFAQTS